jgi:membrane-bound metal-dependent hydrolase YbcI (DUF457 family)
VQSYSHFLLTAVLSRQLRAREAAQPALTFLVGAVAPDVPLALLSGAFLAWGKLTNRREEITLCGERYNHLYFNNPLWLAGHNLFHAPLLLLAYALVGFAALRRDRRWARPWLWLVAGCGLHSAVDFLTHADDGPLPFFPFNWRRRFHAPVSYWDPAHGGRAFKRFERLLDLALGVGLVIAWLRRIR